jgi:hypothetical protein
MAVAVTVVVEVAVVAVVIAGKVVVVVGIAVTIEFVDAVVATSTDSLAGYTSFLGKKRSYDSTVVQLP